MINLIVLTLASISIFNQDVSDIIAENERIKSLPWDHVEKIETWDKNRLHDEYTPFSISQNRIAIASRGTPINEIHVINFLENTKTIYRHPNRILKLSSPDINISNSKIAAISSPPHYNGTSNIIIFDMKNGHVEHVISKYGHRYENPRFTNNDNEIIFSRDPALYLKNDHPPEYRSFLLERVYMHDINSSALPVEISGTYGSVNNIFVSDNNKIYIRAAIPVQEKMSDPFTYKILCTTNIPLDCNRNIISHKPVTYGQVPNFLEFDIPDKYDRIFGLYNNSEYLFIEHVRKNRVRINSCSIEKNECDSLYEGRFGAHSWPSKDGSVWVSLVYKRKGASGNFSENFLIMEQGALEPLHIDPSQLPTTVIDLKFPDR